MLEQIIKYKDIKPYNDFEQARIRCSHIANGKAVKFYKPSRLRNWEETLTDAISVIKYLKTLDANRYAVQQRYNVTYYVRAIYDTYKIKISQKPSNYEINISCGDKAFLEAKGTEYYYYRLKTIYDEMKWSELPPYNKQQINLRLEAIAKSV